MKCSDVYALRWFSLGVTPYTDYAWTWITDFPMFEKGTEGLTAIHHPLQSLASMISELEVIRFSSNHLPTTLSLMG